MTEPAAPSPAGTRSLAARVLDLGIARIGLLVGRSIMFVVFARALDAAVYGHVAVMLAVATMYLVLLDFGLPMLLLRAGAVGAPEATRAMTGLVVARGVAIVPVLALHLGLVRLVLGASCSVSLALAVGLYTFSFQLAQTIFVFQRGSRKTSLEGITTGLVSIAEIGLAIGWFVAGLRDPQSLFWALAGVRIVAVVIVSLAASGALRHSFDAAATKAFLRDNRRAFVPYITLAFAQFLISQTGPIALQVLKSPDDVGIYFSCNRLAWIAYLPAELLLSAAMPRFASASPERFRSVLLGVQRLSVTWSLAVIAATLGAPEFVSRVMLGADVPTTVALFTVVMGATAVAWLPPYALPLAMDANPRPVVRVYVVGAIVSIAAHVVLVPRYGAMGAAMASLVSYGGLKIFVLPLLRERKLLLLDPRGLLPPLLATAGWMIAVRALAPPPLVALAVLAVFAVACVAWQFRTSASMIESDR